MSSYFREHWRRLLIAIGVALYLKFLLLPTAVAFYELHHLTGVDGIYWGYSLFKAAGYYFGVWPYQTAVCIAVAVLIAMPWRRAARLVKRRLPKPGVAT